ncbi:hypothetical protein [Stenotrophomonas rhizophila]|uniref:hypothetical protein n=1 Tax=Stenotrophomonas rhizophila TaxID=216778 RepID=UPI0028AA9E3B|nr:hypothetical protein [Stenotrophomonas rhizophila]
MDKGNRRWLSLGILVFAGWALFRRPSFALAILLLIYWNAEALFGVRPLRFYELGEWTASKPEAVVGAVGIVVAVASMLAFKRVKRLDLELAVGAEIAGILKDAMELITRTREYCSDIDHLKEILREVSADPSPPPERVVERMRMLDIRWKMLRENVPQLRKDQDQIWDIPDKIDALFTVHGAVLRSKVVTPFLLQLARGYAAVIAQKMQLLLPEDDDEAGHFLDYLEEYKLVSIEDFRRMDASQAVKFSGCMGGAASIGTSSIVPPSAITIVALAVKLWRL